MAKRDFKLLAIESFSGGLNYRTDQFDLASNESPDLLNVDVDPRGGVTMREGVDRRNPTALSADVKGMWGFHTDGGTNQLLVNYGTSVAYSSSADFTAFTNITARTDGSRCYGTTFNNVAYGVSYDQPSFKWDGTTDDDLGSAYGAAGNMPQAQYITEWNNFVFVGHVYDGAAYKSRLQWSASNDAETWAASDYVDISKGEHGDYITGLVPAGDRLIIFKSNSIYAMFGFDSDTFQIVQVSPNVGSIPLSSPVNTPFGVFFWHGRRGVHVVGSSGAVSVFDKLQPAIDDGRITFGNAPQLAWDKGRLHVSVDWTEDGSTTRRVLIYDPSLGEAGAWTVTDIDAGPMHVLTPPDGDPILFGGCVTNTGSVIAIGDDEDRITDRYLGSTETHISSHFRTPWMTSRNPIVKKRWGRPHLVTLAGSSLDLGIKVYRDFDMAEPYKEFNVSIEGRDSTSVYDTATWQDAEGTVGDGVWGSSAQAVITDVLRLPTLGTARAISMRIDGPVSTNNSWEVNAVTFSYLPRRMR